MRSLIAACAVILLFCATPSHAQTVTPTVSSTFPTAPLPKSLFPKGSTMKHGDLSNQDFTCQWALLCDFGGAPAAHSTDADTLQRVSGWGQIVEKHATRHVHGKRVKVTIAFEFVPSLFSTSVHVADIPANQAAFQDFYNTTQMAIGVADATPAQTFTADGPTKSQFQTSRGALTIWTAAYWTGPDIEVEALALCDHCSATQRAVTQAQFLTAMHTLSGVTQ